MTTATKVMLSLLLVLAGIFGWLLWNITWIESEVDTGFSEEAELEPYLAASLFLQEQGFATERRKGLGLLDTLFDGDSVVKQDDTLVLLESYNALDLTQAGMLVDWVGGGGTAFYAAQNFLQGETLPPQDYVLEYLSIVLETTPIDEGPEEVDAEEQLERAIAAYTEGVDSVVCTVFSSLTEFEGRRGWQSGRMNFAGNNALYTEVEGYEQYFNARGAQMLLVPWGKGQFIVTTDARVWDNAHLSCFDHAYALRQFSGAGKAWFLENRNAQSLPGRLWALSPLGCTLVLVTLLLLLHRGSRRFGPMIATPSLARRSFLEHLEAGAQLLWDRRQGTHLVEFLRKDIHNRMQQLDRRFAGFGPQRRCEAIAQATRLPLATVTAAMTPDLPARLTRAGLQDWVADLQRIRSLM